MLALALFALAQQAATAQEPIVKHEPRVQTVGPKRFAIDVHGHIPARAVRSAMAAAMGPEAPAPQAADGPGLEPSQVHCGSETSKDDVAHALTTLPRIKVVYAYPSDGADRFARYRNVIASAVALTSANYRAQIGRGLRFDYGNDGGNNCLDIQTVALPHPAQYYTGVSDKQRFDRALHDVDVAVAASSPGPGETNYLIFADELFVADDAWSYAQGERAGDDSQAGIVQQHGGRHAVVWGGGADAFIGADGQAWYLRYTLAHELGHVLGAVQNSAPHATGAAHCFDQFDVMCYDDGGQRFINVFPCTLNPLQWDQRALDCNHDDYADADPPAGSYLDTHWNINRSNFTCTVCLKPTVAPTPALLAPDGVQEPGAPVLLDASGSTDADGTIVDYSFDLNGDGTIDQRGANSTAQVTLTAGGTYAPTVTVTDDDGLTAKATASLTIAEPGPSPVVIVPVDQPPAEATRVAPALAPALPAPVAASSVKKTSAASARIPTTIRVAGGRVAISVSCDCSGTLRLTPLARNRPPVYSGRFDINGTRMVKIRLTAAVRRSLARTGRLKVRVHYVLVDAATARQTARTVASTLVSR